MRQSLAKLVTKQSKVRWLYKQILSLLQQAKQTLPADKRRGVRMGRSHQKKGMVLGEIKNYFVGFVVAKQTRRYRRLTVLCNCLAQVLYPKFRYGTIQVNEGHSALHVDSLNTGPSLILVLGKYTGGEVWTWEKRAKARKVGPAGLMFNGLEPHMTFPYSGERFSLVFFNQRQGNSRGLSARAKDVLRAYGFHLPLAVIPGGEIRKDLLPLASDYLQKQMGISRRLIGDWSNKSIPHSIGR